MTLANIKTFDGVSFWICFTATDIIVIFFFLVLHKIGQHIFKFFLANLHAGTV